MDEKLYIQDIINLLAEKQGMKGAEAEAFVKAVFDIIKEALETDKIVKIKGLGTFKLTEVDSRESINVNTGERIRIESHTKISFVPDTLMRDLINKPFSHFETVVLNEGVVFEDTVTEEDEEMPEEDAEEPQQEESFETKEIYSGDTSVEEPVEQKLSKKMLMDEVDSVAEITQPNETVHQQASNKTEISDNIPEATAPDGDVNEDSNDADENTGEESVSVADDPLAVDSSVETESSEEQVEITKPEEGENENKTSNSRQTLLYGLGIVLVSILLGCGVVYFIYPDVFNSGSGTVKTTINFAQDEPVTVVVDSLEAKDTIVVATTVKETPVPMIDTTKTVITGVRKGSNSVIADSTSYVIVGTMTTYKLGAGETLTMVSKRFYETKDLWPYLVMHNRHIIKNPNRVPSGTTIRIPALRDKGYHQ